MKEKFFVLLFFCVNFLSFGQFSEPMTNLEHFDDKPMQWGYYFGLNMLDFKYDYKNLDYTQPLTQEIQSENTWGFNVGLSGSVRLMKYLDLKLEPGLFYNKRHLYFPGMAEKKDYFREVNSTYIYVPLLLKYSAARWYNFKPFVIGGASITFNLSSNDNLSVDNSEKIFRAKQNIFFYELGIGFDIYTPYFRLAPSIRGIFSLQNELIPDNSANSPWTGNLNGLKTRGFLINLLLE